METIKKKKKLNKIGGDGGVRFGYSGFSLGQVWLGQVGTINGPTGSGGAHLGFGLAGWVLGEVW